MKEQFKLLIKPSSEQKNGLREFLQGQNLLVNLKTGVPASSSHCKCTVVYSISLTLASIKTNQEIMIFTAKQNTDM